MAGAKAGMLTWLAARDEALFLYLNNEWGGPLVGAVMAFFTVAGDFVSWFTGGLVFILFWESNHRRARLAAFFLAMFLGGLAVSGAKEVFDRDRPLQRFKEEMSRGEVTIKVYHDRLYHGAFPSGHSQAAFTAATFFALYYRRYRWALLAAAGLVAFSRIMVGVHFPADIVAGSLFGAFTAWVVYRFDPARPGPGNDMTEAPPARPDPAGAPPAIPADG